MVANKPCSFCQKLNWEDAMACELCKKPFPLPKLVFGTKSECIQKAAIWTGFNFLVPPIFMAFLPQISYLVAAAIWAGFVLVGLGIKWFLNDGNLFQLHSQVPQTTGMERYRGINFEILMTIVLGSFNKMIDAWEDLGRHYS